MNQKFEVFINEIKSFLPDLTGKSILEVGADHNGELVKSIADHFQPRQIVGINLKVKNLNLGNNAFITKGDIRKTEFDDNCFDFIISLATFEHIFDLDVAFNEMHRILKPGGFLYSKFGPIWSSSIGHHLWLPYNNEVYNFQNTALPPFCHLYMTRDELKTMLSPKYESELCNLITEYVFDCQDQNRLFYEDYKNITQQSMFNTVFFYGVKNFPLSAPNNRINYLQLLSVLYDKYPGYREFCFPWIFLLLHKPH